MKLSLTFGRHSYIPITAVPYVTDGFFTQREIVRLIAVPDILGNSYGGVALPAFSVLSFGRLAYVESKRLSEIASHCFGSQGDLPSRLVADIVVGENDLRELMHRVSALPTGSQDRVRGDPCARWDVFASVPTAVWETLFKSLPYTLELPAPRANSKAELKERIRAAVDYVVEHARTNGLVLDLGQLPGYKEHFIKILCKIDPKISRSRETLDAYFAELGLHWKPGSRPKDVETLMALFRLPVR